MTIRKKLTLLYGGLLALVVVVFGILTVSVVRWAMIDSIDSTLDETTSQIINNSIAYQAVNLDGTPFIKIHLPELDLFRASDVLVQVWETTGRKMPEIRAASENLGGYREPLDETALVSDERTYHSVVIDQTEWRVLTRPVPISGQFTGQRKIIGYVVQAAASLSTVNQTTNRLLGIMLIGTAGGLLGMTALSLWFSDRALKPIDEITRAAASIANADDLATRLPYQGPMDELGKLVKVFNHMMERLQQLFSVQQRFVADVSHELRTPLTAIRGNIELMKRYGADAESLEAIDGETARMSRMVEDLLLLARADYGGLTLDLYPLDLDTVVSEVYQQGQILARSHGVQIKMARFEPARVRGNTDRLKQLILNLVNNAIKYTPESGTVSLSLYQRDGQAVLDVTDTGIGIDKAHMERIFDRFFQVDPSRTAASDMSGAGLGLSIAKWIAEAHDGAISVESEIGRGSTFTFAMPLLESQTRAEPEQPAPKSRIPLIGRITEW